MYKILVPSMGRCGSTLMCDMISTALNTPYSFTRSYLEPNNNRRVLKTHAVYTREPDYEYRAVYMWASVGDVLASLYLNRTSYGGDPDTGMRYHLVHLGMEQRDINRFFALNLQSREEAFEYLIYADRIGLKNNYFTWDQSPHALFIKYKDFCRRPRLTADKIGAHLDIRDLSRYTPTILPRKSHFQNLPGGLQELIKETYPWWML